jgi:hypothetical protein
VGLVEALNHMVLVWREHFISAADCLPEAETREESSGLQTDEKFKQFLLESSWRLADLVQLIEDAAHLGTQLVETVFYQLVRLVKTGYAGNGLELNRELAQLLP